MVTNFAAQWLFLRDIEAKQPDELLFPDFDESLRAALRRETELFLDSILRENRSVLDLLTANYTFVNERLAKHYGIPNIAGQLLPASHVSGGQPARRPARAGQHSDADVVCHADVAGAARQVGARESACRPRRRRRRPIFRRLKTEGTRTRQDADDA